MSSNQKLVFPSCGESAKEEKGGVFLRSCITLRIRSHLRTQAQLPYTNTGAMRSPCASHPAPVAPERSEGSLQRPQGKSRQQPPPTCCTPGWGGRPPACGQAWLGGGRLAPRGGDGRGGKVGCPNQLRRGAPGMSYKDPRKGDGDWGRLRVGAAAGGGLRTHPPKKGSAREPVQ